MEYIILFLIAIIIIVGLIVCRVNNYKHKQLLKQVKEIEKQYPRAFKSYITKNKININTASLSILKSIIKHGYTSKSCDVWLIEENRLREIEKKTQEINRKYAEIAKDYPEGLQKWNKLNLYSSKEKIVSNRDIIVEYEKQYKVALEYERWEKEQLEFTQRCRNLRDELLQGFGCYNYYIPFSKSNKDGEFLDGKYLVWQFFSSSYCLDDDLDYSDFEYIKENTEDIGRKKIRLNKSTYNKINEFIAKLSTEYNISVYFCVNNKTWNADEFFRYSLFLDDLDNTIDYEDSIIYDALESSDKIDYDQYPILKNRYIIIIEVQTDNNHLKEVCKNIIEANKDKRPLITYISLSKGYDRAEMQRLIDNKKKEKADEEEKKRKEQEKRELGKYKTSRDEIIKVLNDNEIKCLYHFTSVKNIDSIKRNGGLYSWWSLKQKDINVPFLGGEGIGQKLDLRYGLQDYVRLSFCNDHPMSYKHIQNGEQLVLLEVDIEVATWKDTFFSDINATDNNHQHGDTLEDLLKINFNAVKRNYVKKEDSDFKPHQAEVMVKTFVPIKYIKNIDSPLYLS